MTGRRAERLVVVTMRLLAAAFAVTGILFVAAPDGVVGAIDDAGGLLGDFAPGAGSDQKLWLGLAFAYMVVITAIALVVQTDVARFRPLLLVLAAGKAASSLAAGAFFLVDDDAFAYLLNFAVDGLLVGVALACWGLAGRANRPPAAAERSGGRPAAGAGRAGSEIREAATEAPAPPA